MANNAAKLAGLAALAGAAYMFNKKKDEGTDLSSTRPARPADTKTSGLDESELQRETKRGPIQTYSTSRSAPAPKATSDDVEMSGTPDMPVTPSSRATPGGDVKRTEGRTPMPSLRSVEARAASNKTDAMRNASRAAAAQNRKMPMPQDPVDQIPGQNRSGPTGGERVDSTELSRNLAALTPFGGGVGKVGAELMTAGRTQRAYNAAQAARRSAEGMSPAEALAAREAATQAARDAKTLNPNAWLAGPKGMAENFRKGGKVKKMASGGMTSKGSSASRRGDGIASRGKTRGKLY
jgi:hypothetical protein